MALDDFLTIPEAVKESKLSRSTLYKLRDEGNLRFRKVKGRVFVKKQDIEKLLE